MQQKTDFLIIGSGIAGLSYALKVAEYGKVMIITKASRDETNTKYAQGGIAAVTYAPDSVEKHIADTLDAGDGLCDEKIVRLVITEGMQRIGELIGWGADFDKDASGKYDLAREGGHSEHRILHHKDSTGAEIERTLLEQITRHPNITLHTHLFALDLITQHHLGEEVTRSSGGISCYGIYALNLQTKKVETILSRISLVATGGAGQLYRTTTNPRIATGDGVAMVYRAKGTVRDMEFIQFHPTGLYHPGESPCFLISEAVRGAGAILRNHEHEDFMPRYDERGSLAPRDIVARAIDNEIKLSGGEHVYLDCSGIGSEKFLAHFPTIHRKCLSIGLDPATDFIPVAPAAHYLCGGINVNEDACTDIGHLYAAGECARTGLHGANRLASNSLLEALVFAHRAALHSSARIGSVNFRSDIPDWNAEGTTAPREMILITENRRELQALMSNYVGIVRSNTRLKRALDRLRIIYGETEALYERTIVSPALCELRNLINVSYLVVKAAMARTENRGLHYNTDLENDQLATGQ
ncbi:MAG: L-aspartate oxidase [Bacteroidia bacterium]|nr:L-aspartate oxidase [Bacteroidia bacterium]